MRSKNLFFLGMILAASGLVSPPVALLIGVTYGFTVLHPFRLESHTLAKFLLQASVVALGFGMNLDEVLHAGKSGFAYTAIGITVPLILGLGLGRLLRVERNASFLITCGTALCGGSAIAAIAPIIEANQEDMAVSLGAIFSLNAVALFAFPAIGWALHMSQQQFGLWAALAIHDTSSVVGAGAKYGAEALQVGTTVKLARALWIVPLALATSKLYKSRSKVPFPWFILLFGLAAVISTYVPAFPGCYAAIVHLGRMGLTVTLFLIGTGLSGKTLRQVGIRPMAQGLILWIVIATLSLLAIQTDLIHL